MKTITFISLLINVWSVYQVCRHHNLDKRIVDYLTNRRMRLRQYLRLKVITFLIEPTDVSKPKAEEPPKPLPAVNETPLKPTTQKVLDVLDMIIRDRGYGVGGGVLVEELFAFFECVSGATMDSKQRARSLVGAISLSGTLLYEDVINKIPKAQERIIEALDEIDGVAGRTKGRAKEYLKFLR